MDSVASAGHESAPGRGIGLLGHKRQHYMGRVFSIIVDGLSGGSHVCLARDRVARVGVAVEAGKIAA